VENKGINKKTPISGVSKNKKPLTPKELFHLPEFFDVFWFHL
jgi:hypothetical protein